MTDGQSTSDRGSPALERAERLLRVAGRVARLGGWMYDIRSGLVEMSDEVCAIHELPPGSAPSLAAGIAFYAPEYRERIAALVDDCLKEGKPYDEELELITAKGNRIWVRAIGEAVREADGKIVSLQGAFQDITESKRQEARVRESKNLFSRLAEAMPHIVWTTDARGRVEFASRAYFDYVGLPYDEAPSLHWFDAVHPDDLHGSLEAWRASARDGTPYAVEFRLRSGADGTWRWHAATARPDRDEKGQIVRWYGTSLDIHDRKLAADALAASEARLRAIFESEPECVKVVSPDGRLVQMNAAGLALIEADEPSVAIGRQVADLITPADLPAYEGLHARALCGETAIARFRIRGLKGTERWMESHATPMRDAAGRVESVLSVTRDITDRQQMEAVEKIAASESSVLHLISRGEPLGRVLEEVVRVVETLAAPALASLVLLDRDGKSIRCGAAPNLPEAYCRAIDGEEIGPQAGSCGAAMFRREQVIVTDIATDPLWEKYRTLAAQHGLKACWSTPIIGTDREVLASFALYYTEVRRPDPADLMFIARATHVARMAIERFRQAQALRESEERFRQLAENIAEAFWLVDVERNRFLYVSPAFEEIWGLRVDDLYLNSARWMDSIHEADRPHVLEALEAREEGGYNVEYRVLRPDGTTRWVADRGFPVREGDGKVRRVVGAARDITKRKETEAQLRASEQRFHAVASAIADVLWDWDLVTDRIWWSDSFLTVFGYAPDEVDPGPESWTSRIHPEDRDRVVNGIRAAIAARRDSWTDQYRFIHHDGRIMHVEDRGRLIAGPDGAVHRLVGGMRDISRGREAEERILDLQLRLETLIREARTGIMVHQDFKPVLVNPELARLMGYGSTEEVLALPDCRLLFAEEERERMAEYNLARTAGRKDVPGFYQVKGLRKDGSFLTLENRAFSIPWGGRMSVCAMLVDVSDRIELEERLRQAQRLEAVGQLTGGVAHDFNNLLTVILGNAEILAESLSDDQRLRMLAEMTRTAAERGADLTNRLLAFSRRQTLDPKPTDIGRLVADMDGMLRRSLGEHIEIETVRGGGLWRAFVDTPQLENAVLNLCINARDAMPSGGRLTIEMSNAHLDQDYADWNADVTPGQYVQLAISDTGTGMPPDVVARAFEPFFTTKEVGKGSGLGLSMVFGFVKQSNGHVKIYSEPGLGTTVKLYLPRSLDVESVSTNPKSESPGSGGREKILLVEDDDLVRDHVADQLRSLGYRVVTANNGPEAMEMLRRTDDFDLLFTDVVMPGGMSGRQLADAARLLRPDLPVLFTSGYSENAVVHHGRLDPGVQILNKPYRGQDLARKILQVLGKPAPRRA